MNGGVGVSRTISFDLDGTLVHGPFGAVLRDILPSLGGGADAYPEILRRHEDLLLRHPYDAYDWIAITASVTGAEHREVTRMLENGLAGRPVRIVHDDTEAILTGFRESRWRVVVLTNGRRMFQVPVIATAGLAIDELVTSDDVGEVKPAAAMFAAARGGAERHVHVGDRLDHDVGGARSVGATSVLLRPDAPVTAWTTESDATRRGDLERYLLRVTAEEGTSGRGIPVVWPDAVASSLAGVRDLLR